jgi:hypothetical protein
MSQTLAQLIKGVSLASAPAGALTVDSSGRVGIGTSSPSEALTVSGKVKATTEFKSETGNDLRLNAGSANRDIFMQVNGSTLMTVQGSTGNLQFNSGYGSVATAYGCRAWVNFNGTSTVAIRASGNVSSITDNGTGDYTVNFTTAMPDVNYSTTASVSNAPGTQNLVSVIYTDNTNTPAAPTTSAFRMQVTANSGETKTDATYVCCSIFR